MFIRLTASTSPAQAIKMAYDFATALRATGWPAEDLSYARALWVGSEYKSSGLLMYLNAGFDAGYLTERMPATKDVPANDPAGVTPELSGIEPESTRQALAS